MTFVETILILALMVMTGCGAVSVYVFLQQRKVFSEIDRLRVVFQDLLSIQERNFADLRAESRNRQDDDSRIKLPSDPSSTSLTDTRTPSYRKTEISVESGEYQESVEMARKKKQVWNLADSGMTVEEISRQIQLPSGQVDVILNMRHLGEGGG
jgi:hypothetical protein